MKRLIEWDSFDVRVDGAKLNAMIKEIVAKEAVVERLEVNFSNGLMRVEGSVKKFISVPFAVEITEMQASGTTVRVPLARITAGPLPVPALLIGLIRDRLPKDIVTFEAPATLVVTLERFLPSFVTADVQKIWIIEGGLAVTLGRGGADLPEGGKHGPEVGQ